MKSLNTLSVSNSEGLTPVTRVRSGEPFSIGKGFEALSFRDQDFLGAMDPLVMVDHYRMTKPTFGAHPHAGMSAVSVIFEDSEGPFHNRDSLGNDFDIMPGDLYWLKAGSGAVHDESPREGSQIHGLQVFINLPSTLRNSAPESLHIKSQDMPVIECEGCRIRIVLGESNGISGHQSPTLPMTILDGTIDSNTSFSHQLREGENSWITVVKGELMVLVGGKQIKLLAGQAMTISGGSADIVTKIHLLNTGPDTAHLALFAGEPTNETYVQNGPFIMGSDEEIAQVKAAFAEGKFGQLA